MIISITRPPRQLQTWEYYCQIKLDFMRHQWQVLECFWKSDQKSTLIAGFWTCNERGTSRGSKPVHIGDLHMGLISRLHRAELTAANTTIKNLSEAVVNFSCTGNVSKTQEEEVGPTPQLPLMMMTPHTDATLAPWWVKSANPMVIKPTWNMTTVPQQPPAAMSNRPKANPHCLILQFKLPIPEREHKNVDIAHKEINTLLDTLEVPMYFHIMAVNWSRNGNLIITTMASGMVKDLLSHSEMIGKIFMGNTLISALPDLAYFRAKVNMLSTKDFEGNV